MVSLPLPPRRTEMRKVSLIIVSLPSPPVTWSSLTSCCFPVAPPYRFCQYALTPPSPRVQPTTTRSSYLVAGSFFSIWIQILSPLLPAVMERMPLDRTGTLLGTSFCSRFSRAGWKDRFVAERRADGAGRLQVFRRLVKNRRMMDSFAASQQLEVETGRPRPTAVDCPLSLGPSRPSIHARAESVTENREEIC